MASTRNNNTPGNYKLEQRAYSSAREQIQYVHGSSGKAYNNSFAELGMNPSYMSRTILSDNSVDIETSLFGINSTNLVNPMSPIIPELTTLPSTSFFNLPKLFMPEDLIVSKTQRPYPIPN